MQSLSIAATGMMAQQLNVEVKSLEKILMG